MATAAVLQTRITDAENALHDLQMGARVVKLVSPNGNEVEYQQADSGKLQSYITWLKSQLATGQSTSTDPSPNRRPIFFSFGR